MASQGLPNDMTNGDHGWTDCSISSSHESLVILRTICNPFHTCSRLKMSTREPKGGYPYVLDCIGLNS